MGVLVTAVIIIAIIMGNLIMCYDFLKGVKND